MPDIRQYLFPVLFSILLLTAGNASAQDTTTVRRYIANAIALSARQPDSADIYFRKAGDLAQKIGFTDGLLDYTRRYTLFLYNNLRFEEALAVSAVQLEKSLEIKHTAKAAAAYNNMALQYQAMGKLQQAADHLIKALEMSENLDDPLNKQKYLTNLASIMVDLRNKPKSLLYARKGHEVAAALNDPVIYARSLVNLIASETLNKMFPEAIHHAREVLDTGKAHRDTVLILTAFINLSHIYNRIGQYDSADIWSLEADKYLTPALSPDYKIYVDYNHAESWIRRKQPAKAAPYFYNVIGDAESYFPKSELREILKLAAEFNEMQHQPALALDYWKRYMALNDSMNNTATQSAINELEIQYATARKEQALAQQQLELQQKDFWIWVSWTIVGLLVGAGAVAWILLRQRQKAANDRKRTQLLLAQLSGEEKERARTAQELHDGVGSILSAAKIHMHSVKGSDPEASARVVSLIEDAAREVRNISHSLDPEILLEEGLEYALRAFLAKISHPGLSINLYTVGDLPRLTSDQELLIYRIIQEAMNNIIRHAAATEAIVQLGYDNGILTLTVEDNGKGFDPSTVPAKGIGLGNMVTRISLLKGHYEISSRPGEGTSIYAEFAGLTT
ncbi:ATP-binding protein [Chitinophaga sp.]|uniref:tetratricopeptide repeat-containing sensor histidine kinase n=1 Tax=Chitinophaga sp. TaxID=1869181 RepID=UPI0026146604|nr:ATP-binding protein [uncultured Chitinophaga sp.]